MENHNRYSTPKQPHVSSRRDAITPRDWWNYRLKTAAGAGIALTIFGFTAGPKGILTGAVVGFPVTMVMTTLASSIALRLLKGRFTSDRAAFLGGACGFFSGATSIGLRIALSKPVKIEWTVATALSFVFIFLLYGSVGAVGGWVGSLSWSEPRERSQRRKTVARLRKRQTKAYILRHAVPTACCLDSEGTKLHVAKERSNIRCPIISHPELEN